jgi:glycosyltransferase involved in cell wall biosynthesis
LAGGHPSLALVKVGGAFTASQNQEIDRLGIRDRIVVAGKVDLKTLAKLYRDARAVLVTSDAEGFGLPVIEALAAGAVVFASDIPVLKEVGEGGAVFCPVGRPHEWATIVGGFLTGNVQAPPQEARLRMTRQYSWRNHAQVILDAYRDLPARRRD